MARKKEFKFSLTYKGATVAQSDWSSILFAQKNKRPDKASHYEVIRNSDGLPAGS